MTNTFDDLGELPDDDVELVEADPDREILSWVFVSHTTADAELIKSAVLPEKPFNFHLLNYKSEPKAIAEAYKRKILVAMSRCAWFMVAVSPNAVRSKWVRFEVRWAAKNRDKSRIVVLLLRDCDPSDLHPALAGIDPIDFRSDKWKARAQLKSAMPEVFA